MPKILGILSSGLALVAGLALAWTFRYAAVNGQGAWTLAGMGVGGPERTIPEISGGLRVGLAGDGQTSAVLLRLPGAFPADALHMEYRIRMHGLRRGDADWEKGRIAIQWLPPDGRSGGKYDPVHDFSGDGLLEIRSRVVASPDAPAVPRIWLQDFGAGGGYVLESIKVQPVRERGTWKWIFAGLGASAFIWFAILFRQLGFPRNPAMAQSAVCLGMTFFLVLPKAADIKPQIWQSTYDLGSRDPPLAALQPEHPAPSATPPADQVTPESMREVAPASPETPLSQAPKVQDKGDGRFEPGAISPKGSIVSWVRMRLNKWMVAIHLLAFASPCFVLACLGRARHACWIGAVFAAASEGSQGLFGDATDHHDLIDLGVNLLGVALGTGIAYALKHQCSRRWLKGGNG